MVISEIFAFSGGYSSSDGSGSHLSDCGCRGFCGNDGGFHEGMDQGPNSFGPYNGGLRNVSFTQGRGFNEVQG